MPAPWWLPFGRVPELSAVELSVRLSEHQVQLLDVRTQAEWRSGHIEGALNHPIQELARALEALPFAREDPVIAICRSAHRSIPAVRLLRRAGYEQAMQLAGGMNAWLAASLPVVRP